jgi:hypothetical protein
MSAMAAVPAVVLVTACGNSTSPKATSTADTVGVNANAVVIERYSTGSDSGYEAEYSSYDGDYAEIYNESGELDDYREVMQYALPALHGQRVVDSATVYEYVVSNSASGLRVPSGHLTAAETRLIARRARNGHALGPLQSVAVMLDHLYIPGSYADSASWGGQQDGPSATLIAAGDATYGWKTVSVTSAVKSDYAAGHSLSSYRIRYSSSANGGEYYTDFGGNFYDDPGAAGGSFLVVWSH